jgi:hypothetical protein
MGSCYLGFPVVLLPVLVVSAHATNHVVPVRRTTIQQAANDSRALDRLVICRPCRWFAACAITRPTTVMRREAWFNEQIGPGATHRADDAGRERTLPIFRGAPPLPAPR